MCDVGREDCTEYPSIDGCDYDGDDGDDDYVEYSKLDLHPKSRKIQEDFDVSHKVNDLSVAEKIHFDEVYSEIKFLIFFG
ncbi:hypothetical protein KAU11_07085, partial [Candidatus Babeliales bacterium]|nr:hypothetical protein [Candidatus Babeliales bacterium]